ncbi:calpain-A-like [Elysia marginata]|uniref:Calpain-A-like n=1 Tax=Elysia marginata TaxID=1093978 RepID=A0AAV4IKF6_9GAST|nr:calpain-A-like [Elysia marginata]
MLNYTFQLEDPNCGPLDLNYFKYHASVAKSPTFINMREVCGRHKLEPGTYAIIPSTFEPHYEGEFLMRIFTEKPNVSGHKISVLPVPLSSKFAQSFLTCHKSSAYPKLLAKDEFSTLHILWLFKPKFKF